MLEQRIAAHLHGVDEHVGLEAIEPRRHVEADEVDAMAAPRQLHADFGSHDAGAAERGIAGDADVHGVRSKTAGSHGRIESRTRRTNARTPWRARSGGSARKR